MHFWLVPMQHAYGTRCKPLPNRMDITLTSDKWMFHLLAESQSHVRDMIIMVFWRIWHLRNKLAHGKTIPSVEVSCSFLSSYYNLFCQIALSVEEIIKGKSPMVLDVSAKQSVPMTIVPPSQP